MGLVKAFFVHVRTTCNGQRSALNSCDRMESTQKNIDSTKNPQLRCMYMQVNDGEYPVSILRSLSANPLHWPGLAFFNPTPTFRGTS